MSGHHVGAGGVNASTMSALHVRGTRDLYSASADLNIGAWIFTFLAVGIPMTIAVVVGFIYATLF